MLARALPAPGPVLMAAHMQKGPQPSAQGEACHRCELIFRSKLAEFCREIRRIYSFCLHPDSGHYVPQ